MSQKQETVSHQLDAANGRVLFVDKGCVICHAVNGVGGKAAPALDAEIGGQAVDPLEFAARMWRGAPAMIELQSVELGYSISLTADEIGNLAAFAADREQQKILTADDLPETIKNGLLDEQFWEIEDWDGFLKTGREGDGFEDSDQPDEEAP
ncbi:MAG: cytochrome c [Alphaproteobacteria bacterium]|nr:cytochrome c [Alphaproteobacteria bacterium]